ncbi:MAG TPA: glycoside hydrolase family 16 protein [Pilimelia sp.]|nr:glycoside hydrolase family 16 protein [Pilimelia sp.]
MGDGLAEFRRWPLAWSDEFDGPAGSPPDPATWRPEVGGHGWANEELQFYTDDRDNASLDGEGNLAIVVRRTTSPLRESHFGGCAYTSARLISKDRVRFSYGLVQARIRLPRGRGIWPAFWLLGQNIDEVGWPECGEIDVMENFGKEPTTVHGTVHGPGYSGRAGRTASHSAGGSLADGFHLYSVCWQPDRIRWYLDDELYSTVTPADLPRAPWVFDHDFFLLLNVAVGGTFSAPPDGSVTFPAAMLVDHVRVYAPAATSG